MKRACVLWDIPASLLLHLAPHPDHLRAGPVKEWARLVQVVAAGQLGWATSHHRVHGQTRLGPGSLALPLHVHGWQLALRHYRHLVQEAHGVVHIHVRVLLGRSWRAPDLCIGNAFSNNTIYPSRLTSLSWCNSLEVNKEKVTNR